MTEYSIEDIARIKRRFHSKKAHAVKNGSIGSFDIEFPGFDAFLLWWTQTLQEQDNRCYYCDTSEESIRRVIAAKKLGQRKVRGGGTRGRYFELDRKDPHAPYFRKNCVLVCMFCNNDKSNVYDHAEYKQFFGPARKKHFEWLEAQLSGNDTQGGKE